MPPIFKSLILLVLPVIASNFHMKEMESGCGDLIEKVLLVFNVIFATLVRGVQNNNRLRIKIIVTSHVLYFTVSAKTRKDGLLPESWRSHHHGNLVLVRYSNLWRKFKVSGEPQDVSRRHYFPPTVHGTCIHGSPSTCMGNSFFVLEIKTKHA